MKISEMNWMQVEARLREDDRAVLPIGSTEQHAYLSLATDSLLAERVACEAAEPLGVPVFPVIAYGIAPHFRAYPGSISLRVGSLLAVVRDVLDSLEGHGFRRILIVNGHGGNAPVRPLAAEWMAEHPAARVRVHDWWNAPRTTARVREIDPVAAHASWMESFPWTRVAGASPPAGAKPLIDFARLHQLPPGPARELLGDGNFGGRYQRSDEEILSIWRIAVEETRALIEAGWE
ncbi:MAG TPA: creatininase family protein [Candidatus Eisenbacteria bacterium]|jgi:creatinine amidohydrolase